MTLSTEVSQAVVGEIVAARGNEAAAGLVGVAPRRLAAFLAGRGRLNERDLDRIAAATGKAWQAWAVAAAERLARTPADHRLVADTRALFEPADAATVAEAGRPAPAVPARDPQGRRKRPVRGRARLAVGKQFA